MELVIVQSDVASYEDFSKLYKVRRKRMSLMIPYKFYVLGQIGLSNSADQDQAASEEAV